MPERPAGPGLPAKRGHVDAELLVCTRCHLMPEQVPVAAGRFTDPDLPAVVYFDNNTHRLVVVPHHPDCWQLADDIRRAAEREDRGPVEEVRAFPPHQPDWYHDGLSAEVRGRLCRVCRVREPVHQPIPEDGR